jgi:uncharacterized protein DUF4421
LASGQDTAYINQFVRLRNIQLNTWVTSVDFSVNPRLIDSKYKVTLTPNVKGQIGMSAGFKWFTLSLGLQVPGTESDQSVYGKTRYIDFYFGGYKNQYGGEVYYRSFTGLFCNATANTPSTIISDAKLINYGLTFLYVFNKNKFSMRSAIGQQELQQKSAGSFVLFTNYNYRSMTADSSVIPATINTKEIFNDMQGLNDIRFHTLNIRPGYAHNFVARGGKWFISPSAFIGLGIAQYDYRSYTGIHNGYSLDADAHAKLSAGYNHDRIFFNFFFVIDQNYTAFGGNSSSLQTRSFGLNFGYRLHSFFNIKWL